MRPIEDGESSVIWSHELFSFSPFPQCAHVSISHVISSPSTHNPLSCPCSGSLRTDMQLGRSGKVAVGAQGDAVDNSWMKTGRFELTVFKHAFVT